jgi:hypothetical protein
LANAVDVDAATTWPRDIMRMATRIASEVRGSARFVQDMRIPTEIEDEFRSLFVGHPLRAYHATRLLPHEEDRIRDTGLVPLSEKLVASRIRDAADVGALSPATRDILLAGHVFAEGRANGREGHVSLFVGKRPLDRDVAGLWGLLTTWGGEGIYMSHAGHSLRDTLRLLGAPTIVIAAVELGPDATVHGIYPELWKLFGTRLLGRESLFSDLFLKSFVPPAGIIDFWQPGHPSYDVHTRLPRN